MAARTRPGRQGNTGCFRRTPERGTFPRELADLADRRARFVDALSLPGDVQVGDDVLLFESGAGRGHPRHRGDRRTAVAQTAAGVARRGTGSRRLRSRFGWCKCCSRRSHGARLLDHPVLSGLSVLRFANATNFRVTDEQWEAVLELLAGDQREPLQVCRRLRRRRVGGELCVLAATMDAGGGGPRNRTTTRSRRAIGSCSASDSQVAAPASSLTSSRSMRSSGWSWASSRRQWLRSHDPYWPDEDGDRSYPYRLTFDVIEELSEREDRRTR